ncbi:unnamed protein product [Fraxinus pennsylvanica]|uniref:Fe2OG dioxygenase domain-containing protein n=1 Tax=Fraxinus pennsylvanica TaxID=56036 RepID=A0AAD1ZG53_9LAMI|nr:unnamed protein product [Fraxinus pennsylvanica]
MAAIANDLAQQQVATSVEPSKLNSGVKTGKSRDTGNLDEGNNRRGFGVLRFAGGRKAEIIFEYAERSRFVARTLLQGMSENLGLEEVNVEEILKLDSMFQLFAVNYYPPCPQPDQAIGLPPHTDHGLLTFLIQNGVAGLQIQHNGKWFNTNSPQNSILVNTADQLEIFSNGKYKSVKHRAVVNNQATRISVVIANGP